MDAFLIVPGRSFEALETLPRELPASGFLWLSCARSTFQGAIPAVQDVLAEFSGSRLLDFHVSDLLNTQLTAHFDFTSTYDVLVFCEPEDRRRDARNRPSRASAGRPAPGRLPGDAGWPAFSPLRTAATGFAVFDQVLVSVHPERDGALDGYLQRLSMLGAEVRAAEAGARAPAAGMSRLPDSPAELALQLASRMVDGFLDMRAGLTAELDQWQQRLMRKDAQFDDWDGLLRAQKSCIISRIFARTSVWRWINGWRRWRTLRTWTTQRARGRSGRGGGMSN